MTDTDTTEKRTPAEIEIDTRRKAVDLEKAELDLLKAKIDLKAAKSESKRKRREADRKEREAAYELATDDFDHGLIYFNLPVRESSVDWARTQINAFMRMYPGEDLTFEINSGGGSVTDGYDLFGVLREAAEAGHKITTRVSGFAGSMAGILAQAGDHRQIRRHSYFHLHEAASGVMGKASEIRDEAAVIDRMSRVCAEIYAQRSTMTAEEIYTRMERREWWLSCEEALSVGFVDEVLG